MGEIAVSAALVLGTSSWRAQGQQVDVAAGAQPLRDGQALSVYATASHGFLILNIHGPIDFARIPGSRIPLTVQSPAAASTSVGTPLRVILQMFSDSSRAKIGRTNMRGNNTHEYEYRNLGIILIAVDPVPPNPLFTFPVILITDLALDQEKIRGVPTKYLLGPLSTL